MLPIRKIVLYKHGVGYFERQGKVTGDATISLQFKTGEMNDVLKSLTVLDLQQGVISSISYESTKPVEKQLEDIAIRLPDENSLTGLLDQIKGARVEVEIGQVTVEGLVTGTESVTQKQGDTTTWSHLLNLLVGGKTLRSFDLSEVKWITFKDPGLQKDLGHLLDILIGAKKKDLKRLTIFANGSGEREVMASYIVETPVWKTSYRVLLDEPGKDALIQGWALVDNTQDEDWEDVALTLVSGLPISFVHDLYSPRYKRRPVVEVREEEAYAPPELEESIEDLMCAEEAPMSMPAAMAPPPAPAPSGGMMRAKAKRALRKSERAEVLSEARRSSTQVKTRTSEVGDLFQYEIDNAVTVKRNQSALVPILQRPFSGKRVAVYNQEIRDKNPMSAVLFNNSTGVTLEGGPVTVLEQETYVGEAMLDTMKPGEERLVPFSVELGVLIQVEQDSKLRDVHLARIVNGSLYLNRYRVRETTYAIKSKLKRPLDMYLEHRFIHDWELVDSADPVEKTENFYRFKLEAPAGKTTKFTVYEKGEEVQHWSISNVDRDQVGVWLKNRFIDDATRAVLDNMVDLNTKSARLETHIDELEEEIEQIFENQERLRENLGALGSGQDERRLRERYVTALDKEEDRLKEIRDQIKLWKKDKEELEAQLEALIKDLEFSSRPQQLPPPIP